MKRLFLNIASLSVIAMGGLYLASPAQASVTAGTCTAGNGATCSGDTCCANAEFCYSTCPIVKQT
jgi:hypothetical protein